ncbi:ParB/RepB/Spo0J family partition protein [Sphingomonas sp.]|uniref:ParB/RepB/Spo0J family partition protein n=1 Tax=Sphingomonas sp. TaxID=28214 RepID=UPI0025D4FD1C|nr:ParB/RepB/Spo0J family partition protein [Sphingomonas sp.]
MATKSIPLKLIDIPPDNRDEIREAELEGLAATMMERGQLSPLLVRPRKKGRFELIAGERRLRAAKILKWDQIEVKEMDLDDRQAAEVHAIENLQRVDLTPWEEARKLADLAGSNGSSVRVEDLAARLGRTPQWVAVRLAVSKLIPELRQLVIDQEWPLTHLPLLARIPKDVQPMILEAIVDNQKMDSMWGFFDGKKHIGTTPPRHELVEFLEEFTRLLSQAAWKLDDPFLLPDAGSCDQCPKRSSAQALLFPELADQKKDRCLDEGCWKAKQAAIVAVKVNELNQKGTKPILLKSLGEVPKELTDALDPATFEQSYDYNVCKKTDKDAQPAVFVTGEDAGTVKYVKPVASGRVGNSGRETKVDQETGEAEPPSSEDRLKTLELKRMCRAGELWSEKLETFKPKWTGMLDALVLHFGCDERHDYRDDGAWEDFANRDHKVKLEQIAWEQLRPIFQKRLYRNGPQTQGEAIWEECLGQARALGLLLVLQYCWHDATVDCPMTKAMVDAGVKDPGKAFKEAIK